MKKILLFSTILLLVLGCQNDNPTNGVVVSSENYPLSPNLQLLPMALLPKSETDSMALMQSYGYDDGRMILGVHGIRLGSRSKLPENMRLADHKKAIHLHLNINNERHLLTNTNVFDFGLEDGDYQLFAFINHSYRVAIKNPKSVLVKQMKIINNKLAKSSNIVSPTLIYNMPYGTFDAERSDQIPVDFLLWNKQRSGEEYFQIIIDNQYTFRVTDNQPHYLQGLSKGKHKCTIEYRDANDSLILPAVSAAFELE